MTFPKLEAGSVAVPASVLHQFLATQDLAKTKSVRCLGDGHSSFAIYTGSGGSGFCHAAHEAPPFGRLGSQSGWKMGRLCRPSSCEMPVNSFEA